MKVYDYGPGEKTVIMAVRESIPQRFTATDWTDLRVGFYISMCGDADPGEDNTITGLTETIGGGLPMYQPDYFYIGIAYPGVNFLGFTNTGRPTLPTLGNSMILESDDGIGATGNYWRIKNARSDTWNSQIMEGRVVRAFGSGWQIHVPRVLVGGAYATLVRLRFTRADARDRGKIITMTIPTAADAVYTATPTKEALTSALESFPSTVTQLGPIELSQVPNCLFWYSPFHNSRLRVHAAGIVKVT